MEERTSGLHSDLESVAEFNGPENFASVAELIPKSWIRRALTATDTATIRRRRLPAEQVILLVLGMALLRRLSIEQVVDRLGLALGDEALIAKSSIPPARNRVGPEPLKWLFEESASEWGLKSAANDKWKDFSLFAVDGTTLSVPDTTENTERFGKKTGTNEAAFPAVRLVALMAVRSRTLVAAAFDGIEKKSEVALASELWAAVPGNSLTLVDRGFRSASALCVLRDEGRSRHWMTRGMKNAKWRVLEERAPGDMLVEFDVPKGTRDKHASLSLPATFVARAIRYQRGDSPASVLLSSLTDARYSGEELVALYHERWEIEIGFDEIKTHMNEPDLLRSKTANGVEQELWGLLLAYNLVRVQIEKAADLLKVRPTRISFVNILVAIQAHLLEPAWSAPGNAPRFLRDFQKNARRFVLPDRRSDRAYARAIKTYPKYPIRRSGTKPAAK